MQLHHKEDDLDYIVVTETDGYGGFMITARPTGPNQNASTFCMHYRSLKEFCEEWEDV